MTAALVLLAEVRAAGVQLGLEGGKLLIEVPRGALTAAQRERLVEHRVEIAALLTEPAGDRYGPDEVVADLKTVFTVDGPASHAAAERLAKARGAGGPVGDDLPAWRAWMNRRYAVWRTRGYSRAEALGIVWGEAEVVWHKRHGAAPDPTRCAGCGERLPSGAGIQMLDGAVVHVGDPEQVECLAVYGAQWRGAASVGLMALGLMRPRP
jgi:TubC N-terminal docking domain